MLSKTAGSLFWMCRYLERSENTARLLEVGLHIALTCTTSTEDEWASIIITTGLKDQYEAMYESYEAEQVIDFLLREKTNQSSVISIVEAARNNARLARTALTREVWEAINESWFILKKILGNPIPSRDLPEVLNTIRRQTALVRGAMHGTMLRNEVFDFSFLGTFIERADNTARILDVKYYVLLPSFTFVGSSLDNIQWDSVLRSVSAQRAYSWLYQGEIKPMGIAEFIILDRRLPRSLAFCTSNIVQQLNYLAEDYKTTHPCHNMAVAINNDLKDQSINSIFDFGLHEFIREFIQKTTKLTAQIEEDFYFNG